MSFQSIVGRLGVACGLVVAAASGALAQDMTTSKSANDFAVTKSKLVEAIKSRGFVVVAEVDHAAAATKAELKLAPTHLVIFGNPKGGTPIMACNQTAGIDLPLKALVWQASDGAVNVTVNTPKMIADRHKVGVCAAGPLGNMAKAIEGITADAIK